MTNTKPARRERKRVTLAIALAAVIALGLSSRKFPWLFPASLGNYPGDALWALMVFVGMALVMNRAPAHRLAGMALVFSYLVEMSQLYQHPWINAIRATTPGHLVLGSGFDWLDLCAYTIGVAMGLIADVLTLESDASGQTR